MPRYHHCKRGQGIPKYRTFKENVGHDKRKAEKSCALISFKHYIKFKTTGITYIVQS